MRLKCVSGSIFGTGVAGASTGSDGARKKQKCKFNITNDASVLSLKFASELHCHLERSLAGFLAKRSRKICGCSSRLLMNFRLRTLGWDRIHSASVLCFVELAFLYLPGEQGRAYCAGGAPGLAGGVRTNPLRTKAKPCWGSSACKSWFSGPEKRWVPVPAIVATRWCTAMGFPFSVPCSS